VTAHRHVLSEYIRDEQIKSSVQLAAAINYFKKAYTFDLRAFEDTCGVGIVVTADDIHRGVAKLIQDNAGLLAEQRYSCLGALLGQLNASSLKWGTPSSFCSVALLCLSFRAHNSLHR
jgi:glutaminyl-tRNA synthetase